MTRVLPFRSDDRDSAIAAEHDRASIPEQLDRGVHVAPFRTLLGRRIMLCVGSGGVKLAEVAVREDESEAELRTALERLLEFYERG